MYINSWFANGWFVDGWFEDLIHLIVNSLVVDWSTTDIWICQMIDWPMIDLPEIGTLKCDLAVLDSAGQ